MKRSMMLVVACLTMRALTSSVFACGDCTDPKHKKTKSVSMAICCNEEGCTGDHRTR